MKRQVRCITLLLFLFYHLTSYSQQRFDIVVDEIMADPTPQVGLPNAEYIELKNVSGKEINIQGWRLTTSTSTSGVFSNYTLPADSFLIITSTGNASLFASFGRVLGVSSFPALVNGGTSLTLLSKDNKIIHFVSYASAWYNNAVKEDGGWSLEMIDTHNPCSGQSNWKASIDINGGTPGKKNSVDGINKDVTSPIFKNAYLQDNSTVILQFNEPLDSASSTTNNYGFVPAIVISAVLLAPGNFSDVIIKLNTPIQASALYKINILGIKDCAGNELIPLEIEIGLPQDAMPMDVVINEILFNPKPGGSDFIELYNRSEKIIDLSKLSIANRNTGGAVNSVKKISEQPRYLSAGAYIVLTEDAISLGRDYFVKNPGAVVFIPSMPSYPDDKGTVVLQNLMGNIIDEVKYLDDWHFKLIANAEGVSLEKIDQDKAAQDAGNWHSAATTVGFATPTYKNSQYMQTDFVEATIQVAPSIFSPDNDGYEDLAIIQYQLNEPGHTANIKIFDVAGREVRHLVKNNLLGLKGSWAWDGLDEKGRQLSIGSYIIFTEIFNLNGKKKQFKNAVVLARRLK